MQGSHHWGAIIMVLLISTVNPVSAMSRKDFDGLWATTVICKTAPDGAKGYTWMFRVDVRDGALLGHYNTPGAVPSGTLSGQIDPGGDAILIMQGLTGDVDHTVGRLSPGSPFQYTANVHFDRTHGVGKRNELRDCKLDFVRQ